MSESNEKFFSGTKAPSRRGVLKGLAVGGAASLLSACGQVGQNLAEGPVSRVSLPLNRLRFAVVRLEESKTITHVRLLVSKAPSLAEAQQGKNLLQIVVHDAKGEVALASEAIEWPEPGWRDLAVPATTLRSGVYRVGVASNNDSGARLAHTTEAGEQIGFNWPPPARLGTSTASEHSPLVELLELAAPLPKNRIERRELPMAVHCAAIDTGRPFGTFPVISSVKPHEFFKGHLVRLDDFDAVGQIVPWPALHAGTKVMDVQVHEGRDRAWMGSDDGRFFELRGLNADGVWREITPPGRHPNAALHVYGMTYMNWGDEECLYYGEYSNWPNEIVLDGSLPKVWEYNLKTEQWSLSGEFEDIRHLHALHAVHGETLYVSAGDTLMPVTLERAKGCGIYKKEGRHGKWERLTGPYTEGYTPHYPVDFIRLDQGGAGFDAGIYATSDQPGPHILHVSNSRAHGKLNQNVVCYGTSCDPGETCRSITLDPSVGTLLYIAVETAEPALYASPPP